MKFSDGINEKGNCILLVDDNLTNLQVLLDTLKGRGYRLLVAKNGEAALKIADKVQPALILLDIMMPGIDGYKVCEILKSSEKTSHITVIFLSALDNTKDRVHGLEIGAVDFISKPFQAEEVIARVDTQIKIHNLEMELAERNRQLEMDNRRLLESMREGILGLDKNGVIRFVNSATCSLTGWVDSDLIGQPLYETLLPSEVGGFEKTPAWATLHKAQSTGNSDGIFLNKDQESFPVDYSCTPVLNDDENLDGAVIVFKDITEKKNQQKALEKALTDLNEQAEKLAHVSRLTVMGEMAAGIAHEVNQPLTAIVNYVQVSQRILQRQHLPDDDLMGVLEKIHTQSRRAAEVIHRIRRFVRKPAHCVEPTEPNKLIADIVKLAEVDIRNKGMQIKLKLADSLSRVSVDPVQIQQVALNLIRNAMEAMESNWQADLSVVVQTEQSNEQFVQVSVMDWGEGLADGAEEKLFMPFYTTKAEGMGIGLSICYSIIESHGGRLWYEQNPDGGTIFRFTMPVEGQ